MAISICYERGWSLFKQERFQQPSLRHILQSLHLIFASDKSLSHLSLILKTTQKRKETDMAKTEKFEEDLNFLVSRLSQDMRKEEIDKLNKLRDRLAQLHKTNIVKINHSVMELVCAKHLIFKGYEATVEQPLDGGLTCDLYATKGDGRLIVEIETGFVPPEHALDPTTYLLARIASKIVRYSHYADKFALGIPPYYILQIPQAFGTLPRHRKTEDLERIKSLCDQYYQNPPVSLEEVKNARLQAIYIIDVDAATIEEVTPDTYLTKISVTSRAVT